MSAQTRHRRLIALLLVAGALATGCNILQVPFFLMNGPDPLQPPECMKLEPAEKSRDKIVRVVLMASAPGEIRPEYLRVDRQLCDAVSKKLQEYFKETKEYKVDILPSSKMDRFKDDHPDWRTWELADIGKHFSKQRKVDYVIDFEISSISFYEDHAKQLYRGRTAITTTLVCMNKLDDGPQRKEFTCEYPVSRGPVPVDGTNLPQFRAEFLDFVAKRLTWYFVPHPLSHDITCD